jgi:hypothetical protein
VCLLVRRYEFSEPRILRAVYRSDDELLGRDTLLEGRFSVAQHGAPLAVPAPRANGLVIAPSDAASHPLERLAHAWLHPGDKRRPRARSCRHERRGQRQ